MCWRQCSNDLCRSPRQDRGVPWWSKVLEGVKKHCSRLDVNEYGKEREEAGDLGERRLVFLDGVD